MKDISDAIKEAMDQAASSKDGKSAVVVAKKTSAVGPEIDGGKSEAEDSAIDKLMSGLDEKDNESVKAALRSFVEICTSGYGEPEEDEEEV